jgi:uncharacterized protein YaaR (DUF327 family)
MARVDGEVPPLYMNPAVYSQVKKEEPQKTKKTGHSGKTEFSRIFDQVRGKTAGELGPLPDLPVSEETINLLMDEVRSAGDILRGRPFPDEIIRYKRAVRNFMHFVVEHCYDLHHETGIPNTPEAMKQITYTKIEVIDKKLEDLAAMLLASQATQLELASRLEEIKGLLVDLLK